MLWSSDQPILNMNGSFHSQVDAFPNTIFLKNMTFIWILMNFAKALADDVDFVILCNPNNPTSSAMKKDELRSLLEFCNSRDIFVMIDETYVEFAPDVSEITAMPLAATYDNLMILRGVSKFYAAPGLRLGYGCHK